MPSKYQNKYWKRLANPALSLAISQLYIDIQQWDVIV